MKLGVLIGRMNPPHLGHIQTIMYALTKVDQLNLVIGGHSYKDLPKYYPDLKNPFGFNDIYRMLSNTFAGTSFEAGKRINILNLENKPTDEKWLEDLIWQGPFNTEGQLVPDKHITLFGYPKDGATSKYLNDVINYTGWKEDFGLKASITSGTEVRNAWYQERPESWKPMVTPQIADFMSDWQRANPGSFLALQDLYITSIETV